MSKGQFGLEFTERERKMSQLRDQVKQIERDMKEKKFSQNVYSMYPSIPYVSPSYNPPTTLSYPTEYDYSKHFKITYQIFKKPSQPMQPAPVKPPPRPPRRHNFPPPETTSKSVFESRFSLLTIKTPPPSPSKNKIYPSEGKNKGVMEIKYSIFY